MIHTMRNKTHNELNQFVPPDVLCIVLMWNNNVKPLCIPRRIRTWHRGMNQNMNMCHQTFCVSCWCETIILNHYASWVEYGPDTKEWNKTYICATRCFVYRANVKQLCYTTVHSERNKKRNKTKFECVPPDVLSIVLIWHNTSKLLCIPSGISTR